MVPSDIGFTFSGFILALPILALVIYAIVKIRSADPTKRRKYGAILLIVVLIVSVTTIVVLNLPPLRRIELDITVNFRSNSTSHESMYQYHWEAPGVQTDENGTLIYWNEQYGEVRSYGSGVLDELLRDRGVESFNIQWTEIEPFANSTWKALMSFYIGMVFEGQLVLLGDNQSASVERYEITDTDFSSTLLEGLNSLGIEGLEVYMDITFKIAASVLISCFRGISIDFQITDDLEMIVNDIAFGVIA